MADAADDANDLTQQHIDQLLSNRRTERKLQPVGHCHNPLCCDDLEDDRALFCSGECANEYSRRKM